MSIFLAWVIVGFCSFLIQQNTLNKVLPKYAFGILVAGRLEDEGKGGDAYNPETIKALDFWVRAMSCLISIIIAPYSLYTAVLATFGFREAKITKLKLQIDEIVRRKGQLIF